MMLLKNSLSIVFLSVLFVWVSAFALRAQHPNVLISDQSNPNEPSICIDPKHPNRLVAGANLHHYFTSSDTGKTWNAAVLSSPYGVWGDPAISVDTTGNFYFLHLSNPPGGSGSWIDRIVIQKSVNAGQTWSPGTFTGLNNGKAQDKHWMAVDRKTNHLFITWTEFDDYGSQKAQDSSRILFSKSIDGGQTWTPAQRINRINGDCIDSDKTVEGAVPCIGPNGEVWVAWAGPQGLVFDRSTDGGTSWLANDIKISDFPGGWDYLIPGLGRCNGLPVTGCDLSGGAYHGTLYVNWSDQRKGASDTDVWLAKSTDGGNTWSQPVRVNNDPPGRHQFLTWMAVDQATGWLWFVFYDRRNYAAASSNTDVFMAVSKDGGATFHNFKISEKAFLPSDGQFFGDYTNLTAYNNIIRPIWTRMDNQKNSVWTALVNPQQLVHQQEPEQALDLGDSFPNPSNGEVWVPFKVRKPTSLTMQIVDNEGKVLRTVFAEKKYDYGKYTEQVNTSGLPTGSYWVIVRTSEGKPLAKKVVVVK